VPYDKALLAMVANRLCQPESKLGVWKRWLDTVYLPECQDLKLRQMYDCPLYPSDAADEEDSVKLGCPRTTNKKKTNQSNGCLRQFYTSIDGR